jgi:hypothetical protein
VLDGEILLEARDDGPGRAALTIAVRAGAPANVIVVSQDVPRTTAGGNVLTDRLVSFKSPADPSQPKVLQPGEAIDLQIGGDVLGAAAGSGSLTRRGKRLRFRGTVV